MELLTAAETLFSERGYEGTSVSDIARAAGTYPAVFYRCFEDKAALYDELVRKRMVTAWEHSSSGATSSDPLTHVLGVTRTWFHAVANDEFLSALSKSAANEETNRSTPFAEALGQVISLSDDLAKACQNNPSLIGFPDPRPQLGVVLATIVGWCAQEKEMSRWFRREEIVEALCDMLRARVQEYRNARPQQPAQASA